MQYDLKNFFDYKPLYSEDEIEKFFIKEVKEPIINYLGQEAWEKIQKAYDFAKQAHWDEKRLSWEPYIVHPVYVAKYLLMIKPDITALQAALLHDVIEDTPVTADEIQQEFGSQVAFLCVWLEKVSKVRYHGEARQVETLKKTFLAMGQDIRVIFVKLADRIHNIQTLKFHPKREKQIRIATETLKIYVPIAKRLWIEVFQLYLENGSFAILEPKEFNRIFNYLEKNYSKVDIQKLIKKIQELLDEHKIQYLEIKGRLKSPYRVYLKLQKYNTKDISMIKDILAFRIIVKDIATCYVTLWIIHSKYTPIIKRIKDYISLPKSNWYQSLHTTILWLYKTPVEVQIRTKKMDDFAEYWVAAHFLYKENMKDISAASKQIDWVNKLRELVKEYKEDDNKSFFNILDVEFLRKSIFVYTPKWKVIELPKWATVLDFAFRIHSEIWFKFKSALVNWKIVPIDYKLRNGDIVEIKTFREKYTVKKDWLNYVVSHTSKQKIRQFLNRKERNSLIELWKHILNEKLQELKLPLLWEKDDKISQKYSEKELESSLIQIANKNLQPIKLILSVYKKSDIKFDEEKPKEVKKEEVSLSWKVVIDDSLLFKYDFCPECRPQPGDKIIWKITSNGVKIHKTTCKALRRVNFSKLLPAHWLWQESYWYDVEFIFKINDYLNKLIDIINLIKEFNINIVQINTFTENEDTYLKILTKVKLPTTLSLINKKLSSQSGLFNSYKILFK